MLSPEDAARILLAFAGGNVGLVVGESKHRVARERADGTVASFSPARAGVHKGSLFRAAALEDLRTSVVPLTARTLAKRAKARGALPGCHGLTPDATMYATLYADPETFGRVDGKFFLNH